MEEQKIGRAISAARMSRIRGAIDSVQTALTDLEAMLEEAMPRTEEESQDEGEQDTKADTHQEPQDEAGPPEAPTFDRDAFLAEIEHKLAEIHQQEE